MNEIEVRRLRQQIKLLQRRLRRETRPPGRISRTALQILLALRRLPAGSPPGLIAQELQMSSPNVAAALRELDEAGLIERRRDNTDRRRVLVFPTVDGSDLLSTTQDERDSWLARAIEAQLNHEQQRQLVHAGDLLARLAEFEPERSANH